MVKQPDKSVSDTLNYQNCFRNTLDLIMGLRYKAANLDILIISLVCRCRFSKIGSQIFFIGCTHYFRLFPIIPE